MEVGHCSGCQVMEVLCCLKIFFLEFFLFMCDFTCDIFIYLKFPFLSLLWRDVPYLSRLCSSATGSLKIFLLSFPSGINSPIFSAPQNFSPISLQHRLFLPGCLSASYLTVTSLSRWFVSDTFQVSFSRCCTFSKLLLEMD